MKDAEKPKGSKLGVFSVGNPSTGVLTVAERTIYALSLPFLSTAANAISRVSLNIQ